MKSIHLIGLGLLATQLSVLPIFAQADGENEMFVPTNPPALKPITSHHTPAYQAAKMFQRGVNLGDYLEAGRWGVTITPDDFVQMKREGFDHVRVPVGWYRFAGPAPDFTLSPEIFARVDFAVTNALANKMAVMINIHHFNDLDHDPAGATAEFLALWRQIAAHYQKFPRQLAFELDNEPHENATTALMNPIYARAIAEIRQTNPARTFFGRPNRTIFVEPGGWGSIGELKNLVLPPDRNLIVSVHCYEPFHFTHQGAGWTTADVRQTGIVFPGPPAQPLVPDASSKPWVRAWIEKYNTLPTDKNPSSARAFTGKLAYIRAWSDFYGRPVHLGEFGAYIKADAASRANFYSAFRQAAELQHIGWCIWDWNANFRYWDEQNHCALPGMHAALFGKTK
jgi:endoglucanase